MDSCSGGMRHFLYNGSPEIPACTSIKRAIAVGQCCTKKKKLKIYVTILYFVSLCIPCWNILIDVSITLKQKVITQSKISRLIYDMFITR